MTVLDITTAAKMAGKLATKIGMGLIVIIIAKKIVIQ